MNPSQMMNVWNPFQKHSTQTSSEIVHSTTNVDIRMINNRNIMDALHVATCKAIVGKNMSTIEKPWIR